jgi:hypothetical protein
MSATIHHAMSWDEYIVGGYMGSSALDAWGSMSLEGWSHDYLEAPYTGAGSKYTAGGSALDAALTGDPSGKRFAVKPDGMSFATKDGKAWRDEHAGFEIIDAAQDREIKVAAPLAREAISILSRVYLVDAPQYQTTLRGEVCGLRLQVRPDVMVGSAWIDLKYVNPDSFDKFDRNFVDSRYYIQSGLFHGLGRDAGIADASVLFLLVESGTEFPRVEVVEIQPEVLETAWAKAQRIATEIVTVRDSERGFVSPVKFRNLNLPAYAKAKIGIDI